MKKPHRLAKILIPSIGGGVLLIAFVAYAILTNTFTPQWFGDQITVANFQPSQKIKELTADSGMNDHGKFMFYTSQPQIEGRDDFNYHCAELLNEISNVLGCYDGRTYLFDITDPRIEGVENVTAAHEMLHAAYERLGFIEKMQVDSLIERQLEQTDDPDILEMVELYSQTEPGQEINELHSIFGTEARDLSPELEAYYSKYFSERTKVVAQNEKYRAVFDEMKRRADELDRLTASLALEIDALEAAYDVAAAQLGRDIDNFNYRADSGNFTSESRFYAERNALLARQNQLSAQVDAINAKISEYNRYVEELQALGRDAEKLNDNLNSQKIEF